MPADINLIRQRLAAGRCPNCGRGVNVWRIIAPCRCTHYEREQARRETEEAA